MVKIPGGTFQMGSNSGQRDEQPVHTVTVGAFLLGKTAVTVGQFEAFVSDTGYLTEAERGDGSVVFAGQGFDKRAAANWRNPGYQQDNRHPVTCVSWNDCLAFIQWLNTKTGKGYRLPTEAEWEFAARGGLPGDCYGNCDSIAWYGANSNMSAHPVAQKLPNAYGLYDMIGNVWEWCSDWYGPYSSSSQTNPTGSAAGSSRVNRGGAWYGPAIGCRASDRAKNTPDDRGNGLGFRLALD